jgi:hypothetical protein
MWRGWLFGAWRWLSQNKDAIGSLTAIIGVGVAILAVVVAWYYARLTRRLANTARDQTLLTKEIATETRRQAAVSQQVFEASHRPYLEANLTEIWLIDEQRHRFKITARNHGSVPAINVHWKLACGVGEDFLFTRSSVVPSVLFPGEERDFRGKGKEPSTGVEQQPPDLRVEVTVDYRSTAGREYFTKFFLERDGSGWRVTHEEIGEVPPAVQGPSASGE